MFVNDIFSKKLNEGSEPRFLDDDFYAYDPDTKEIKDTWSHKSSGRRFAENRAREMGWSVVSGMRARSLDLHYPTKKVDEAGPFSYGAKKPRKGSVADLAAKKRQEQERGREPAEPRDQRVGVARVLPKGVAEGISVVDQDYDLDQIILTLDIEGKQVSFTYTDYEEDFENAERRDVFDQLQEQPWYKGLDHPTKMEILDAAYRAIRGLEPQEYRPTVGDEPLDEDWKKVNRRDKTPGMSRKAVKAYRRENPGSKLQTAVTTKPSKLKRGSKSAKRRKSFCARMSGMKRAHAGAKTKRDPDSPINKALRRWNCESIEEMRDLIMIAEQRISAMREGGLDIDIPEIPRAQRPRPEPKNKTVDEGSVQDKLHKRHQELRKKRGAPDPEYYKELGQSYDIEDDQKRHAQQAEIKKKYKVKESADGSVKYEIELDKGKKDYIITKPDKPGDKVTPDPATAAALYKTNNPMRKVKSVRVVDKPKEEKSQMKAVVANEDCERYVEELGRAGYDIVTETATLCPECGGVAYADQMLAEKQDACYHKVKSRYKVWPSAYASGALVRCRKKGAANWGNKSK